MKHKKTLDTKQPKMAFGIGAGCALQIIISVIGAAVASAMIVHETVSENTVKFFAFAIQLLATFTGGFTACKFAKGKYAITAGITAAVYCFVLVAISILTFDGQLTGFWLGVLAVVLGYVLSCATCITSGKGKRSRTRAHR